MIPEDRARIIARELMSGNHDKIVKTITEAADAARLEEREACAVAADTAVGEWNRRENWYKDATPTQIAAAIRARGDKT